MSHDFIVSFGLSIEISSTVGGISFFRFFERSDRKACSLWIGIVGEVFVLISELTYSESRGSQSLRRIHRYAGYIGSDILCNIKYGARG